ncbi:branched-chain amino acid ABC transporter permease [Mesorhizobium sp. 1B3]|uniref:branched-chain amino acid ABC transporter permease n=1 Tax=Mesorhizobium sp. 1B3 TaxID=3243599 RepID=UPI003D96AFC1
MTSTSSVSWNALLAALFLAAGIIVPFLTQSSYFLTIGITAMIFTVFAMSLNIVYGYAGLLSLAQVGFWGVGSYVAALVVTRLGGSIWEGMIAAALVAAAGAILIGAAALRLSNHAFVIVSLCFTLLMQMLAQEWIDLTNGPMGIPGLPAPSIGFGEIDFSFGTPTRFFYLTLAFATVSLGAIWIVVTSRIGKTLRMIKHDETLARSLGVRVTVWKLVAIALASVFAALSGALYVFYVTIVDPLIFDVYFTQVILVIVIIGGLGSFWPVVFSGLLITVLPEILRTPNELRMISYGVILMAAVLLMPTGIAGLAGKARTRRTTPAAASVEVSP